MRDKTKLSMLKRVLRNTARIMTIIIPIVMPAIIGDKGSVPSAVVVHVNVNV